MIMMEGPTLKLILEKGPREGETLVHKPGSMVRIGRVIKGNTFSIKDAGISSKHMLIEFKNSKWMVSDLESSNGTLLNNSKLQSLLTYDLKDGDMIKIGELTSIKVEIVEEESNIDERPKRAAGRVDSVEEECQLRRNPRRGAATKKVPKEGSVAENQIQRKAPRRIKESKNEPAGSETSTFVVQESCKEPENLAPVGQKRKRGAALRRAKSSKDDDDGLSVSVSEIPKIPESSKLGQESCREMGNEVHVEDQAGKVAVEGIRASEDDIVAPASIPVEQKRRRGAVLRRGRFSKEEDRLSVSVSEVPNVPESSNLGKESCREMGNEDHMEDQAGKVVVEGIGASEDDVVAPASIPVDGVQVGGSNSEKDASKEPVSTSGVKENPVKVDNGIDIEKMTLGEWLDYLEVYLPKQIYDATEEIIEDMRERSKQYNELISQHQNGKDKAKRIRIV